MISDSSPGFTPLPRERDEGLIRADGTLTWRS
jgi:hypothetical protein